MKAIIILTTIFSFIYVSDAQLLQNFTAKEGYDFAVGEAGDALANPVLQGLGTIVAQPDGLPVNLVFNLEDGKGTIWVYQFVESDNPSLTDIVVVAQIPIFGLQNYTDIVGEAVNDFTEFVPDEKMDTEDWIDSQEMASAINSNSGYNSLKSSFPDAGPKLIGLGKNEEYGNFPLGDPYWVVNFGSNPDDLQPIDFVCMVDAITGTTECFEVTSSIIDLYDLQGFNIYPQPAEKELFINFPSELNSEKVVVIYDQLGTELLRYSTSSQLNNIDLDSYSPGVYFTKVECNGKFYNFKFLVK